MIWTFLAALASVSGADEVALNHYIACLTPVVVNKRFELGDDFISEEEVIGEIKAKCGDLRQDARGILAAKMAVGQGGSAQEDILRQEGWQDRLIDKHTILWTNKALLEASLKEAERVKD